VLIPVKAPGEGKTRLAGVLGPAAREALVHAMLERVVAAAEACKEVSRVFVAGAADHGLGDRVRLLAAGSEGLNQAIATAMNHLAQANPTASAPPRRVVIAAADLPLLAAADFVMLADVPDGAIAIAPDRHGTGTNALSLPWSCIDAFGFRFGLGSHAAHRAQAARLGYSVETMLSDGLEKDIDEPADLTDARGCLQEAF
jgi:2-phospho-L-lactate guanylyltransferase